MSSDPHSALGAYLTAFEAKRLAVMLDAGETTTTALKEINSNRRTEATRLLKVAGMGHLTPTGSTAILRAIAGARSIRTAYSPVWTMPGAPNSSGRLTSEVMRLIDGARMSITCASYNFSRTSWMWNALASAALRPEMSVTVYVDAAKGTPQDIANHLSNAAVFTTTTLAGASYPVVSHAKFIVIDHAVVLTTSANFSQNAEKSNVELGLLVHDTALADSIESTMRAQHGVLYAPVQLARRSRIQDEN